MSERGEETQQRARAFFECLATMQAAETNTASNKEANCRMPIVFLSVQQK